MQPECRKSRATILLTLDIHRSCSRELKMSTSTRKPARRFIHQDVGRVSRVARLLSLAAPCLSSDSLRCCRTPVPSFGNLRRCANPQLRRSIAGWWSIRKPIQPKPSRGGSACRRRLSRRSASQYRSYTLSYTPICHDRMNRPLSMKRSEECWHSEVCNRQRFR